MTGTSPFKPAWALAGAGLVGLMAVAAGVARLGEGTGDAVPPPAPVPSIAPVPVAAGGEPARPASVLPQVEGGAEDPYFAIWCGSARGVPDLQQAVSYVIQWGDPVLAGELPRTAYAKDVAPDVQGYNEYGDYVIPGATGQEEWTEAVIYCLDNTGTPIANLPAVLDRARHDS